MSPRHKILTAVIGAEALALAALWLARPDPAPRPHARTAALAPETARAIARQEQALRPDRVEDWLQLADSCRAFNLLADADRCYQQVERLTPKNTEHLFGWAVTLSRMGETTRARNILERAIAHGVPEADECRLMLARDWLREENPAAAEKVLRTLTDSPQATIYLARLLIRTGRATEAVPTLDRWLAVNPDDLHARQMRAWAAEELGNVEEALRHRLLALRCRDWGHNVGSATKRDAALRAQFAREARPAALKEWWSDSEALRLASAELSAGRTSEAIRAIEDFITATGATGENLLLLGQAWLAAGDTGKALEAASRAERLGANQAMTGNLQVQQFLADLASRRGDASAERGHRGRMQFELGKAAWAENNITQAHQQFMLATRLSPDLAHAWFYLAETTALLGDSAGARQAYERCLQLSPGHGRAADALARLR